MVDINIVAAGSMASLLSLEAERMGVTYKVTSAPIKNASVYIADTTLGNEKRLDKERTVAINAEQGEFRYVLQWPFLLSELRNLVSTLLVSGAPNKSCCNSNINEKSTDISVDSKRRCVSVGGREVLLSPMEYLIFDALLRRRGEVLTYEELDTISNSGQSNKVNVHVCALRKKLECDGTKIIYSVRKKGYIIK